MLRRVLCLVVTLALVMCLAACDLSMLESLINTTASGVISPTVTYPTQIPTQSTDPTENTVGTRPTSPTEPSAGTDPTDPTEPPVVEKDQLEYTLTQTDVDEFYRLLAETETLALVGEDLDAIELTMEQLDEAYEYMNAQCTIAMILHYNHTSDAVLEDQYLNCVEICTQANDAYVQMIKRLYMSDTPAKDALFEGWTEEDFANLMSYDEQIALLQQRNAEIKVEYRATDDDAVRIELYIEFVQNNNQMAAYYGYDNYYTYAYEVGYERDYGAEELEQLREYAVEYLVYGYDQALMNFYNSFYVKLHSGGQQAVQNFLIQDYSANTSRFVEQYLQALPGDMGDIMSNMLEQDSLFANSDDSMEGAFTTSIGDRSYCYFGPGYATSMTVIHEGGHYYASRYADIMGMPLDLAETHSQGNEWLFLSFLDGKMPSSQYRALTDYFLYENMANILICLMVDEFEQIVYSSDLTGFTAADFDAIMDEVSLRYFPNGDVADMLADVNGYWRMVVVDQPVYYISYAVSAMASISLYTLAEEDYDEAILVYRRLCEEIDEEAGFLENITAAGLLTPFDETFYQELTALLSARA